MAAKLTNEEKAYIAGFFDGEGCVEIGFNRKVGARGQYYLRLVVANDYKPVIDWLYSIYEGSTYHRRPHQTNHRNGWVWKISARKAEKFLLDIYPYSMQKKKEIELAFKFIGELRPCGGRKKLADKEFNMRKKISSEMSRLKRFDYYEGGQIVC